MIKCVDVIIHSYNHGKPVWFVGESIDILWVLYGHKKVNWTNSSGEIHAGVEFNYIHQKVKLHSNVNVTEILDIMEVIATVTDEQGNVYVAVAERMNFIFTNISPNYKNEMFNKVSKRYLHNLIN